LPTHTRPNSTDSCIVHATFTHFNFYSKTALTWSRVRSMVFSEHVELCFCRLLNLGNTIYWTFEIFCSSDYIGNS